MTRNTDPARSPPQFVGEPVSILKLPPGRTLGAVTGLALAPDDGHIWVLHIAANLEWGPPPQGGDPAARLPAIVEFDRDGNFIRAWGGPDHLPRIGGVVQWPKQEETISIDAEGTVWVFGANKEHDHAVQRFTRDGKLLLRIGQFGAVGDDLSHTLLGCPTDAYHDVARREVYISDGYVNHRIAVFNSDTGEFLRAWGAYGKSPPFPASGRDTFNNPVHAISRGPEGHLYVCDRKNDRIQVFDAIGREVVFVRELKIEAESPFGTTFNVAFSLDGDFMFVADGNNARIWIVDLKEWKTVGVFGGTSAKKDLSGTIHKIVANGAGDLLLGRTQRGVELLRLQSTLDPRLC